MHIRSFVIGGRAYAFVLHYSAAMKKYQSMISRRSTGGSETWRWSCRDDTRHIQKERRVQVHTVVVFTHDIDPGGTREEIILTVPIKSHIFEVIAGSFGEYTKCTIDEN